MSDAYKYIEYSDRQKIEEMWALGKKPVEIAESIGVHVASIYNELRRGWDGTIDKNQRQSYSAVLAQRNLQANFKKRGRRAV